MGDRKRERGSALTPAILALLLVILVGVTIYVFAADLYPAPAPINSVGKAVDHQYDLTLYVTGAVFILSQLGLAYAIFRFRDRGKRATFSKGNDIMEILWTTATIILFLGLGFLGRKAWADVRFTPAAPSAIQIEVTGNQFVFNSVSLSSFGAFIFMLRNMLFDSFVHSLQIRQDENFITTFTC